MRPWLYVLEPLIGYIILGEKILNSKLKENICKLEFWPHKKNLVNVKKLIQLFNSFDNNSGSKIEFKKSKHKKYI